MTTADQIAERYIEVWNETDPERRRAMLAEYWAEDAAYADPMMCASGRRDIAAMMDQVHERFPGFRFALDGKVDHYANNIRFCWTFGPAAEPDLIKGSEFAVAEDGRLRSVTCFLDKVPASA